jgi:hypothetical protein
MSWPPHHLNLCCRSVRDLPGDFQSPLATALEALTTTPASSSMPPPSSTTEHIKRKRHDTCDDIMDTSKVWVVGLSVSGCLSLACNGVYMVDGMRNGRPYFYRYSKDKPSPNSNGSCCYISGEWRLSLNNSSEFYCVTSDAYFPPHKGWEITLRHPKAPCNCYNREHPKVITKGTMQLRVGDQVKSLTDWASGWRRVSKGEVGTITGSFERLQQSTGRLATKFRVDYPSVKGLGTWPEQMSYYCPAGNSILLRSELRAWADAQSKRLDNNPGAKTLVTASHPPFRATGLRAETLAQSSNFGNKDNRFKLALRQIGTEAKEI